MSERGVFAVDRGIFDHPVLSGEKYTKVQAFMWLVAEAAWKAHRRAVGAAIVDLRRGQVACSLRFMAQKWGWEEPRVRRFLGRLKTDAMIDAATDAGVTVITICNYDSYQKVSMPIDAPKDAQTDAVSTQDRRKEESKENKEDNNSHRRAEARPKHLDKFEALQAAYPKRNQSFPTTNARKRWLEAMARGDDPDQILVGVRSYAAEQKRLGNVGGPYVKTADSWLHQQRWRDYVPAEKTAGSASQPAEPSRPYADWSDDRWREVVRVWKGTCGHWPWKRSPAPDEANTAVPAHILAEMGVASKRGDLFDGRRAVLQFPLAVRGNAA